MLVHAAPAGAVLRNALRYQRAGIIGTFAAVDLYGVPDSANADRADLAERVDIALFGLAAHAENIGFSKFFFGRRIFFGKLFAQRSVVVYRRLKNRTKTAVETAKGRMNLFGKHGCFIILFTHRSKKSGDTPGRGASADIDLNRRRLIS